MIEKTPCSLMEEEIELLKGLLASLNEERDAILSFSLEDLRKVNEDRKEILDRLCLLERSRKNFSPQGPSESKLLSELKRLAKEALVQMERNRRLLSFSMGHVERSIERILAFLENSGHSLKGKGALLLCKEV